MSNVLSTKVKFERNLKNVNFNTKISQKSKAEVLKLALNSCKEIGLNAEKLETLSENVIENLIALNKLEDKFCVETKYKGYASNDNVNVQINGDSHIEIISQDLDLLTAYSNAKQVDKQLCNKMNFAYSDKYGFLNPDIKKLGAGMMTSVAIMLPALTRLDAVKNLPKANEKLIFTIETIDAVSGIYLIESGANLGYTEKQICEKTKAYIDNVLRCEYEACKNLLKQDEDDLLDKSLRAKAIINSCIKITIQELYYLISNIMIAVNCGLEKEVEKKDLLDLFECGKQGNSIDEKYLAKIIKNILNKK